MFLLRSGNVVSPRRQYTSGSAVAHAASLCEFFLLFFLLLLVIFIVILLLFSSASVIRHEDEDYDEDYE